jgi:hypothetical protein
MKFLSAIILSLMCVSAFATDSPQSSPTASAQPSTPVPQNRVSIFSTTVDWAGVTGLPLRQYIGTVHGLDKKFVKQGLVLYYLDAFPCYGEASNVRVWLSPTGKSDDYLRLVCVYKPEKISFAWRNATADASDARTTGMITCPISGDTSFTIDISKCEKDKDWNDR